MDDIKTFNIRISKEMWKFLKKISFEKEVSMNQIVVSCLEKYKNKIGEKEKKIDAE